eukprot:scaffold22728_cov48-Cyclotella_meneghiniana.AAC.4
MEICRAVVFVGAKVGKLNEYVPGSVIVSVEKAVVGHGGAPLRTPIMLLQCSLFDKSICGLLVRIGTKRSKLNKIPPYRYPIPAYQLPALKSQLPVLHPTDLTQSTNAKVMHQSSGTTYGRTVVLKVLSPFH